MFRGTWTRVGGNLLAFIAVPSLASAQPSPPTHATPPAGWATTATSSEVILAVVALVVVFVVLGVSVKLYDRSHRRREEGVALEARLSDVLLLDSSLSGIPIVASVHMPLLQKYPPVVEVNGTAPTSEIKGIALQRIERELAGRDARIEDHIVIDPQMYRHVA